MIIYPLFHICHVIRKLYNIYYIRKMTQLFEINVKLSKKQKKNRSDTHHKTEMIVIRLKNDSLRGNDTLYVPEEIGEESEIE